MSKAQGTELISLDLIVVSEGLQKVWESREYYEFDSVVCPVVSRSGLIQMKTIAGRPQDLVDIQRLTEGE